MSTAPAGARPCIVTLTPNPSIDRTLTLGGPLQRGAVHRLASVTSQAGGKGVNISRACLLAGVDTIAVLPAAPDDPFVHELTSDGIPSRLVLTHGTVRVNLTVTEPDGTTTKFNSPGPRATRPGLLALADTLLDLAERADWIVLAGSLPPGAPVDWYADLVLLLRGRTKVAVDTSDAPLQALVDRLDSAAPHVLKPNGEELASITGGDAAALESDPRAAAAAARLLVDRGVEAVLATLGGHGAVLVTEEGAWHAVAPLTQVVSTVGAGDSSLFGYLLGERHRAAPAQRLALAVAYGSAAAGLPGTTMPRRTQVHPDDVVVRQLPHLICNHSSPARPGSIAVEEHQMPSTTVVVGSAVGLHARPAAIIAEAAADLDADVLIGLPGAQGVDAGSALMIMTLGAGQGDTVEISGDVEADVAAIAALVARDVDAD